MGDVANNRLGDTGTRGWGEWALRCAPLAPFDRLRAGRTGAWASGGRPGPGPSLNYMSGFSQD